jgi:hypothetical protein
MFLIIPYREWKHMTEPELTLHFPWEQVIGFVLAGMFALFTWTVRTFGNRHITSLDTLASELKEMRKEIANLTVRMAVVEARDLPKVKSE